MIFTQEKLYKTVIGVIFGGEHVHAARIENGKIAKSIYREINNAEKEEVILNEIITHIKSVFNDEVTGIGVGVPSLVDVKDGIVHTPTNVPSWRKVHLKDILEETFQVPAFVNNDANCFALGEKYFGVAQEFDNIAGLTIGTGMGVGIIIDGKLYSGKNAGAGEFCSIPYRDHDYEHYCSTKYFDEKYGIKHSVLISRAKKKDKIALAVFEMFGTDLGNAIKTIMYAIDPDAVVIGGRIVDGYPFYRESMMKSLKSFQYCNSLKRIKILPSKDKEISTYGAAALCLENGY